MHRQQGFMVTLIALLLILLTQMPTQSKTAPTFENTSVAAIDSLA